MDGHLSDLWHQAWRFGIILVVLTLAIPVVSFVSSIVFGFLGVRDEGVAYALRVVALVGVGLLCTPMVVSSLVTLMAQALR